MPRNIIICSDGTGNTFSKNASNVTSLIKSLRLDNPESQLVFYDQGIGTNPNLVKEIIEFKGGAGKNRNGLEILPPPKQPWWCNIHLATLLGLIAGYGLRSNVEEMYGALAKSYNEENDRIFLFGFSRGAFTVRVLAGLLYRCGLPTRNIEDPIKLKKCFEQAYELYKPHICYSETYKFNKPNSEELRKIEQFEENRKNFWKEYHPVNVEIHFLGIWDTVKSYGGIFPQSLPHLRHNPIVKKVCHALSLNERRSWFLPTSWGQLDIDEENLKQAKTDYRYAKQIIKEVWFQGCHSDIGGGDKEKETAKITLNWMLGEAIASGILLEKPLSDVQYKETVPEIHESFKGGWWALEWIPRWELNNKHCPPIREFKWGPTGKRFPEKFKREEKIHIHKSVENQYYYNKDVIIESTHLNR
jgi:uncharacterized protein (DUF2235 family)